jgi:hypothetical protein
VVRWLEEQVVRRVVEALLPVVQRTTAWVKRQIRRLVDSVAERIRTLVEGRRAALQRALERRRYRAQLDQALREAEAAAARRGRAALDDVTDARLRSWAEADPRHRELAYDPAHRGFTNGSVREAQAGLAAESQGILRGPIRRDLTGGAEFIDGAGRHWDVKGMHGNLNDDANSIVAELTRTDHHVLMDASAIEPAYQRQVIEEVRSRLTAAGRADLMPRLAVVRPRISREALRTTRILIRRATESEREEEGVAAPR